MGHGGEGATLVGAEAGEDPSRTRGRPPSSRPPQDVNPPDGGEGGAVGDEGWEGSRLGLAAGPRGDEVVDRRADGRSGGGQGRRWGVGGLAGREALKP